MSNRISPMMLLISACTLPAVDTGDAGSSYFYGTLTATGNISSLPPPYTADGEILIHVDEAASPQIYGTGQVVIPYDYYSGPMAQAFTFSFDGSLGEKDAITVDNITAYWHYDQYCSMEAVFTDADTMQASFDCSTHCSSGMHYCNSVTGGFLAQR